MNRLHSVNNSFSEIDLIVEENTEDKGGTAESINLLNKLAFKRSQKQWRYSLPDWVLLSCRWYYFNPIQDGHFRGCWRMGGEGGKRSPLPKICHTYPTMIKLDTVIPYLKKIQKIYGSRDTRLDFCWQHHFFTENWQISRNTDIDCILVHNF